jgi:UPF0176 protein
VPKTNCIELATGEHILILHEDRSVLAIDKPRGWMLVPFSWQRTARNLQAALTSSIAAGDFWARSRNLKFLRFIHRLDADTTGILLFARSRGALDAYRRLFESREMEKVYLAVVDGAPDRLDWTCRLPIGPDPTRPGKMRIDQRHGKPAETLFHVLQRGAQNHTLLEARPTTGRTHQIRIHLAASGCAVAGDPLYGTESRDQLELGLRAVELAYTDPFTQKRVRIQAPTRAFLAAHGFDRERHEPTHDIFSHPPGKISG